MLVKKRDGDGVGKFDFKIDEGIFVGYSSTRRAYRFYNKILKKIIESANVKVDETRSKMVKWKTYE